MRKPPIHLVIITALMGLLGFSLAPIASADPGLPEQPLLVVGDSVAAGAGLAPGTLTSPRDLLCGRSSQAYVHLTAQALGLRPVNLSCSGAKTWQGLVGPQLTASGLVSPQLLQAAREDRIDRILVTVGANDIKWSQYLQACASETCDTAENTAAFAKLLKRGEAGLTASLIGLEALRPSQIVVTGYYDPFAGNSVTPAQLGFTPGEVVWYQERLEEFKAMLRETTAWFACAVFVPIDFGGHGAGGLVQGPGDPAPFHPTAAGQQLIADTITAAL